MLLGQPKQALLSCFESRNQTAVARIDGRWFTTFAGVIMVEATKGIYARPVQVQKVRRRPVYLPLPGTPSSVGR